jgi:hypothetical protein
MQFLNSKVARLLLLFRFTTAQVSAKTHFYMLPTATGISGTGSKGSPLALTSAMMSVYSWSSVIHIAGVTYSLNINSDRYILGFNATGSSIKHIEARHTTIRNCRVNSIFRPE